jgi:hypothetical protein
MLGGDEMSGDVIVLSTQHELQGEKFHGYVEDPFYEQLLKNLIVNEKLDFIFEEASGRTPTITENLASSVLGPNRYLDVDPSRDQREGLGISPTTNEPWMIGTPPNVAFANWQFPDVHAKREEFWIQRMMERDFTSAVIICGLAHGLSFAFRLQSAKFKVKAITYGKSQSDPAGCHILPWLL